MATAKPILVPVDGSPSSLRALAVACERAGQGRGSMVVVLNVQQPMAPSRHVPRSAIDDHHERMSGEVFRKVDGVIRRKRVDVSKLAAVGMAATMIVRQAERLKASEIVMGTRGAGRIGSFLLGSVAMKVVQLAKVPVTLVR